MFPEFLSSSYMGVSPNSQPFLPEKDLNEVNTDPEFNLLARPVIGILDEECQTSTREGHAPRPKQQFVQERDREQDEDHQEQQGKVPVPVPEAPLGLKKLKIPLSRDVEREKDDSSDGFKTPTSSDHRIPAILRCPPAPRKPKSRPPTKRKDCRPRIVMDISQDLESLFPMLFVVDLGPGCKSKKAKQ